MQIIVATIDGTVHKSDIIDESELQAELDKSNGQIGSGGLSHVTAHDVDEFVEVFIKPSLEKGKIGDYDIYVFNLAMPGGQERGIKPGAVAWFEIVRD